MPYGLVTVGSALGAKPGLGRSHDESQPFSLPMRFWQWFGQKVGYIPDEPSPSEIATREPVGLAGDVAARQSAQAYREAMLLGQQQQIGQIGRQWATAGRYTSGQRNEAMVQAGERLAAQYGDFLRQTALQRYLAERGFDIEAARIQAQLEAGQPSRLEYLQAIGQASPYLYELYQRWRGGQGAGREYGGGSTALSEMWGEMR